MSAYAETILELAPDADPRLVEAWMRLAHPTLDHLARDEFALEVEVALRCIDQAGVEESEQLAASYGLGRPAATASA